MKIMIKKQEVSIVCKVFDRPWNGMHDKVFNETSRCNFFAGKLMERDHPVNEILVLLRNDVVDLNYEIE